MFNYRVTSEINSTAKNPGHIYGRHNSPPVPSHADQLHVDLWWRSLNVAQDAGTYLYNADPPWDNNLTTAQVHNTVTVNGRDQFTRAGRFLYLDWFNAYRRGILEADPAILQRTRGRHWGYWRMGVRHART